MALVCDIDASKVLGMSRSVITKSTSLLKHIASFFIIKKASYQIEIYFRQLFVTYSFYKL